MKQAVLVLLAMWLGAALLLVASVAPAAFDVLPSRTLAGALVGRVLPVVFISGIIVAIPTIWVFAASKWAWIPAGMVFVCCVAAQFQVGPRIAKLRAQIGGAVDSLPVDDPQRVLFGKLHATSVAYLGGAILGAVILLILLLLAMRQRP